MQRTREIAVAEVRFAVEFGALNERVWQSIDTLLNFGQIGAGALALTGAIVQGTTVAAVAGGVLAAISAIQLSLSPLRRSIAFRDARVKFNALNARAPSMTLEQIDSELEALRSEAPQGMRLLEMPALNIVNVRHGFAPARELKVREKAAMLLA